MMLLMIFNWATFRATQYDGDEGYYTYVSDDYLLDFKVYIDGNWGDSYTF